MDRNGEIPMTAESSSDHHMRENRSKTSVVSEGRDVSESRKCGPQDHGRMVTAKTQKSLYIKLRAKIE